MSLKDYIHRFCLLAFLAGIQSIHPIPITYGGITIECHSDCGDEGDPYFIEIYRIIEKTVKNVCGKRKFIVLDPYKNEHLVTPWIATNFGCDVLDWQEANGYWGDARMKGMMACDYGSFLELASQWQRDLSFYFLEAPRFTKNHLDSLLLQLEAGYKEGYRCVKIIGEDLDFGFKLFGGCYGNDLKNEIEWTKKQIEAIEDDLLTQDKYYTALANTEEGIEKIDAMFNKVFLYCLKNHQEEGVRFREALEYLLIGDFEQAFHQISSLIDWCEKNNMANELLAKLYLLKGEVQSEFCLYGDAVVALTQSIQKNPLLKESYFERAAAYFELGEFDKAIEDYLASGYDSPPAQFKWSASAHLSAGLVAGLLEGGAHSLAEFVPESISTIRGLSNGLWALVLHPIDASSAVAGAAAQCAKYIKETSSLDILQEMVPELKNLIQNYDQLGEFEKGHLIGQAIGKYGTDILLCKYSAKAVKAYIELKKANQALTLKALTSPETGQKILEEAGKRWTHREAVLKNSHLRIEWDKQGKHIQGHRNFDYLENKSIWECSREKTEQLINDFAGTGIKGQGSQGHIPGKAGYREVVDFGEFIGYHVNLHTKTKTPTTWGTIHYAKNGVHIVPHLPKVK